MSKLTRLAHLEPTLVLLGKSNSPEIAFGKNPFWEGACTGSPDLSDMALFLEYAGKYMHHSRDACVEKYLEYLRSDKGKNATIPRNIADCK